MIDMVHCVMVSFLLFVQQTLAVKLFEDKHFNCVPLKGD